MTFNAVFLVRVVITIHDDEGGSKVLLSLRSILMTMAMSFRNSSPLECGQSRRLGQGSCLEWSRLRLNEQTFVICSPQHLHHLQYLASCKAMHNILHTNINIRIIIYQFMMLASTSPPDLKCTMPTFHCSMTFP